MAEVVDAIIAELIARDRGYVATFEAATKAHQAFTASIPKIDSALAGSGQSAQTYADRHRKAAGDVAQAEEQTSQRVKRAKKAQADTSIAEDTRATASATRAAKVKADVEIAEAERSARSRARINSATYGPPRPINIIESGAGRPQTFGFGNPSQGVSDRPLPVGRASTGASGARGSRDERSTTPSPIRSALQGRLTARARRRPADHPGRDFPDPADQPVQSRRAERTGGTARSRRTCSRLRNCARVTAG
jgi:hypothetical protein